MALIESFQEKRFGDELFVDIWLYWPLDARDLQ